jgi:hypothetical protein
MVSLPTPLRAAIGLAATVVDEARRLPDRAIELPMLAVSTALQMSLRAQQKYVALAARGEEVLSHDQVSDEPPEWARFDDDAAAAPGALDDDVELAAAVADLVDDVDTGTGTGTSTLTVVAGAEEVEGAPAEPAPDPDDLAEPGLFGAEDSQPAADGLEEADDLPGTADTAALTPEPDPPAATKRARKTVRAPRNARPSRFDVVGDE